MIFADNGLLWPLIFKGYQRIILLVDAVKTADASLVEEFPSG